MKCIISSSADLNLWTHKFFPDIQPHLLKILNKPIIEYYIDLCVLIGIKDIRIAADSSEAELNEYLTDGTQWGVNITYALSKSGDSLKNIVNKNKGFIGNEKLLLFNNLIFVNYDKKKPGCALINKNINTEVFAHKAGGLFVINDFENLDFATMEQYSNKDINVNIINSIHDYFEIAINQLKYFSKNYAIPGYNTEDNIFMGQNVKISRLTQLHKPSAIGNNVRLHDAVIGPLAIIGSNSFIDKMSKVENAIVYDNTYIGSGIEIKNKIIFRKLIIDPETGETLDVPDDFIISRIKEKSLLDIIEKVFFGILALIITALQFPLYFLLIPFTSLLYNKQVCIISSDPDKEETLDFIEKKKNTLINSLFFKLSLNKFPLLLQMLKGKLFLTGNTPLKKEGRELINDMSNYRPAVFTINEMMNEKSKDSFVRNINELYYSNNLSFKLNIKILIKTIIQNILN